MQGQHQMQCLRRRLISFYKSTNKRDKRQKKRRLFFYLKIIQRVLILSYIYIIINREYITDCIREGERRAWTRRKKRKKLAKEPGPMVH
uniref:Uncharacterized protein n=1 Tax=Myoviridae sp. ctuev19 TaxID=2827716 RepID=A0A8S5SF46_9CAUD|nr:MAG TPA: hypothetical protein [Myoviridae sp. ctuev19]